MQQKARQLLGMMSADNREAQSKEGLMIQESNGNYMTFSNSPLHDTPKAALQVDQVEHHHPSSAADVC